MIKDMMVMEVASFIGRLKKNHDSQYDALALQLRQMAYGISIDDTVLVSCLLKYIDMQEILGNQSACAGMTKHQQDVKNGIVKPALKKNLDNAYIKELKDAGLSNKEIASMFGVTDRTIRNRLKSMEKQASIEKEKVQVQGNEHEWKCCF